MKYSKSKKSGFTLVELIVVLTILALLAALLIPALTGYIEKAKKNKVIAETRMLHEAVQTVTSELYAGSAQWKASSGGTTTLASSSGDPIKASSALAGVNLKDCYNEVVKLSVLKYSSENTTTFSSFPCRKQPIRLPNSSPAIVLCIYVGESSLARNIENPSQGIPICKNGFFFPYDQSTGCAFTERSCWCTRYTLFPFASNTFWDNFEVWPFAFFNAR